MAQVFKITGETASGRCYCGHRGKANKSYWLVNQGERMYTYCYQCGLRKRFTGKSVSMEEMNKWWFGDGKAIEGLKVGALANAMAVHHKFRGTSAKKEELEKTAELV